MQEPSIRRPIQEETHRLRLMNLESHALPRGLLSPFIQRIQEAISCTRACDGGYPCWSCSIIQSARNSSCGGVNRCWCSWPTRRFALPFRLSRRVPRGTSYAVAAALLEVILPDSRSARANCIICSWLPILDGCLVDILRDIFRWSCFGVVDDFQGWTAKGVASLSMAWVRPGNVIHP